MITVDEILEYLISIDESPNFLGDKNEELTGFSSLKHYQPGTITWVKSKTYIPSSSSTENYSAFITSDSAFRDEKNAIMVNNSKRAFFSIIEYFWPEKEQKAEVGYNTFIGEHVKIGKNVRIGHNCVLDGKIEVDENTVIWNNVTMINKVKIGKNSEIRSGVVIGHDDSIAYYTEDDGEKIPIRHHGGVVIGNNVVIGENSTLCRGTIDDTVLEDNVWIDAQTMVSHNCYLQKDSTVIGASKLFGSVVIGPGAYVVAATIRNQVIVGKDSIVGMGAIVTRNVSDGVTVVGNPARNFDERN